MFNHLGIINENQGAITEAEQKYQQVISYFKSVNFQSGIVDGLNRLGVLQLRKSNYTTATNFFLEAMEVYDKLSLPNGIAECYLKLLWGQNQIRSRHLMLKIFLKRIFF